MSMIYLVPSILTAKAIYGKMTSHFDKQVQLQYSFNRGCNDIYGKQEDNVHHILRRGEKN